jgi:cell division protein FtsB
VSDWPRWPRRDERETLDGELSDARPVAEHKGRHELDPEARRRIKLRRRAMLLGLCGICLAGSVVAVVGNGGHLDRCRLRDEIARLDADIARREAKLARLEEQVQALGVDPLARERVAREQLGLVWPGEVDFLLPKQAEP